MPATPARAAREEAAVAAERARTAATNEAKFTEFRLNCDAGVVGACNALGEWYELMRGDAAAAAALYAPACLDHGYAQACWNLGKTLGAFDGATYGDLGLHSTRVDRNPWFGERRRARSDTSGSDSESPRAAGVVLPCSLFACLLRAPITLHPVRCCTTTKRPAPARSTVTGKPGVRANVPQAIHVLTLGCEGGNTDACHDAGLVLLREAHARLAHDSAEAAAAIGGGGADSRGGEAVGSRSVSPPQARILAGGGSTVEEERVVRGVQASASPAAAPAIGAVAAPPLRPVPPRTALSAGAATALAERLLSRGCSSGGGAAAGKCCYVLAAMYGDLPLGAAPPSPDAPRALLERACAAESVAGCQALARAYAAGLPSAGLPRDPVAARAALRRAMLLSGASEARADKELARLLPPAS